MFKQVYRKTKLALISSMLILPTNLMAEEIQHSISTPQLNAQTYILMDYHSGTVLAALNPDQRQYPASLTKMMTSYVIGDALKQGKINNSDIVTVGESAWGKISQVHLRCF